MVGNWLSEIFNPFLCFLGTIPHFNDWRDSTLEKAEDECHAQLQLMFNASLQSSVKFAMWIFLAVNVILEISSDDSEWILIFYVHIVVEALATMSLQQDQWYIFIVSLATGNLCTCLGLTKYQHKNGRCPLPSVNLEHLSSTFGFKSPKAAGSLPFK